MKDMNSIFLLYVICTLFSVLFLINYIFATLDTTIQIFTIYLNLSKVDITFVKYMKMSLLINM